MSRSLKALLNSTIQEMSLGIPQTQTVHKIEGSKPYIHTPIVSILKFHTCDLLLLLLLLLLPFFSLLRVCSLFLQDPKKIFILVLFFLFHFLRRKLPPSFLKATCLFHNFSSLFHSNIFLLLLFGPSTLLLFVI